MICPVREGGQVVGPAEAAFGNRAGAEFTGVSPNDVTTDFGTGKAVVNHVFRPIVFELPMPSAVTIFLERERAT